MRRTSNAQARGWGALGLLLLVLLLPALDSSYLSYDGSTLHFGTGDQLAVQTCLPSQCFPGFGNLSGPPRLIASARPLNDSIVEFVVMREGGQPSACVLGLSSLQPIESRPSDGGSARFETGDFGFSLVQAGGADAFMVEVNGSRVCLRMGDNSTVLHFFLVPEPGIGVVSANATATDSAVSSGTQINSSHASSRPDPNLDQAAAPVVSSHPNGIESNLSLPPALVAPLISSAPLPTPSEGLKSAEPLPLAWIPSADYLVLTGLFLAILAISYHFHLNPQFRLAVTLLPLLIGFFILPLDGFRPVGLIVWGLFWLAFFFKEILRRSY